MNKLKHFSFDLWFTLIKSNPSFKKERALYFYKNLNYSKKTVEEIETVFRNVDLMCNSINEKTGKNIDAEEMYLMVIFQLNNSTSIFEQINIELLYNEMEDLILKHIPLLFNSQTPVSLYRLKQDPNNTLNILSNTAFIKGSTLRKILAELEISHFFDFQIYSDEVGLSKPNKEIFNILLEKISETRNTKGILLNEIIHIGDNPVADIYGAKSIGINTLQINTNKNLITSLFN